MSKNKLRIASLLMTVSLLAIVVAQAYWLSKTFKDEYRGLRREVSIIFREIVLKQQMKAWMKDSVFTRITDTSSKNGRVLVARLSGNDSGRVQAGNIRISMPDSQHRRQDRMFSFSDRHNDPDDNYSHLVIHFPVPGTLVNMAVLEKNFKKEMAASGITLPYTIQKAKADTSDMVFPGSAGERLQVSLRGAKSLGFVNYELDLGNPFWHIMKRMAWPSVLSLLMLLITLGAFVFLYRNLRAQQKLAAMKNDFISNITHELKTPVATVSVAIEALKNFNAMDNPQRTREYLDISANELNRLGILVDKVLKISMFEQNKLDMKTEPVDMKQLTQDVLASMKLQFEKYKAQVHFETSGEDFRVTGDKTHLVSVLYNLVDNALKYGKQNPQVNIHLQTNGQKVDISVADNGIGIPAEFKAKVFDKFFRVPHGNTHNIKGYGLGLSYVAGVVQQHKGNIKVESTAGEGSVFTVELPKSM